MGGWEVSSGRPVGQVDTGQLISLLHCLHLHTYKIKILMTTSLGPCED